MRVLVLCLTVVVCKLIPFDRLEIANPMVKRIAISVWGSNVTYSAGVSVSSWAAFASMVWELIRKKDGHVVDERYSVYQET